MGKLVLNGREYAGIMPNSYPPLIYSDEEREVGVWRDGKPLYEKTLTLSAWSTSSNWIDIEHGIANVDKIVDAKGFIIDTSGSFTPIPQPRSGESKGFTIDFTTQYLSYLNNWKATIGGYLTVQYTKSTDTPGSGKWSPSGLPAKHYSENEQVIGTWIDGKPIYERVINFTSQISVTKGDWCTVYTDSWVATIDRLISGVVSRNQYTTCFPVDMNIYNNDLRVSPLQNDTISSGGFFIIRYTKTTD